MTYLSQQIRDLEDELNGTQLALEDAESALRKANYQVADLEYELDDANEFIEYVDKTRPELRAAFEATKKLEGEKT